MVVIGLIDDNEYEIDDIRATITTHWANIHEATDDVNFKLYELRKAADFKEVLQKELLQDIEHERIQSLIIDYKLDTMYKVIEGRAIAEYLHAKVPAFPVVILTNAPDKGKQEDKIDPDKVYAKEIFFNLDPPQNPLQNWSRDMVFNIYRNIERYIGQRANLESSLSVVLDKLTHEEDPDSKITLLAQITALEDKLSQYTYTGQTTAEKSFDLSGLRDVIANLLELEKNL